MISRPHLCVEPLESRRLLSSEGIEEVVNNDAELFGATPGHEPIYPPLAPAMWIEDSAGSFELPQEITSAFFAPDEPSHSPITDDEPTAPPPDIDAGEIALPPRNGSSIAQILFGEEREADAAAEGAT